MSQEDLDAEVMVLFAFEASTAGTDMFIELKRPAFKGGEISKYVSWFRFDKTGKRAERLSFVSWLQKEGVRTFKEGILTVNEDIRQFEPVAGSTLTLVDTELTETEQRHAILKACVSVWE
jgi:hypothetical protein